MIYFQAIRAQHIIATLVADNLTFLLAVDSYDESEPVAELYPFQDCFP